MVISIGDYDFCDGSFDVNVAVSDLRMRFTRGIEVVQTLGAINPTTYDRGTRRLELSFTIHRVHASIKDAELFIGNHENAVPQSGTIKIVTTGISTSAYLLSGFLVGIQLVRQIGLSTSHSYRIVGGIFDTKPGRPQTLNQVISTGVAIGLWPSVGVPVTPATLTEVIAAGTTLGLWPSGPVPVTPTTLNEVIAAGTALNLWL